MISADFIWKKFFNLSYARKRCDARTLPPAACDYIRLFNKNQNLLELSQNTRFIVFDTETTGLNPKKDFILSIGAVPVFNSEIVIEESFDRLIKFEMQAVKETVAVHGIMPSESLNGEKEKIVFENFLSYIKDSILVAHHADFDITIINSTLDRLYGIRLYNRYIDTINLAQRIESIYNHEISASKFNLDELCSKYGISTEERHTAVGDAYITAQLFMKFLKKYKSRGSDKVADLFR